MTADRYTWYQNIGYRITLQGLRDEVGASMSGQPNPYANQYKLSSK